MAAAVLDLAGGMSPDEDEHAARIRVIQTSPLLVGAALRTRAAWEAAAARELARSASRDVDVADLVAAGAAVGALHVAVSQWFARASVLELLDCVTLALAALWPDVCPRRPPGPDA